MLRVDEDKERPYQVKKGKGKKGVEDMKEREEG
jgi:hypothetical protein